MPELENLHIHIKYFIFTVDLECNLMIKKKKRKKCDARADIFDDKYQNGKLKLLTSRSLSWIRNKSFIYEWNLKYLVQNSKYTPIETVQSRSRSLKFYPKDRKVSFKLNCDLNIIVKERKILWPIFRIKKKRNCVVRISWKDYQAGSLVNGKLQFFSYCLLCPLALI